ncbi:unnamed protein product [Rotaria magnacalcarata]|uniref:Uncharacterized protein n=1 Tax=Rotaria magnacalcarata TaxID=392030 RepID=A0A820D978_9BILA|nr:unnamed protein product [Rotaria magnacalcarata]CAF4223206.1 unnamed protein product [Rotaria magnacalcarata]
MDEIVFKFVKPLQTYPLKSKCTCSVCPKLIRETTSHEIGLIKTTSIYLNFVSAFTTPNESLCGGNLGRDEPLDYPADYMIDDQHPSFDPETKLTHLETRYICQATRITQITKLFHRAPFIIANVENDKPCIQELADPLFVGEHEYSVSAAIKNTGDHFIAMIKSNNNQYYCFNDLDSRGCYSPNGFVTVDFAIYVLKV